MSHTRRKTASLSEMLETVIHSQTKKAEEVGGGTTSQVTGPNVDKPVVEGERAKEHDAINKEVYGETAATQPSKVNTGMGNLNPENNAAKVLPSGEDPAAEKKETSLPSGIDAGTSLPGATMGGSTIDKKVATWVEQASDLLLAMLSESDKVAAEDLPAFMAGKLPAAGEKAATDKSEKKSEEVSADKQASVDNSNIYTVLGGDAEGANQLYQHVTAELAKAAMFGRVNAHKVAALLKAAEDDEEEGDDDSEESEPSSSSPSAPEGELEASGSPMAGGAPTGGGDLMGGLNAQAIIELIGALPPEEQAALMEMLGGGGGAPPMGGDPMAGGAPDPALAGEALGELSGEMGMPGEDMSGLLGQAAGDPAAKMSAETMKKISSDAAGLISAMEKSAQKERQKLRIKEAARGIIKEVLSRGKR